MFPKFYKVMILIAIFASTVGCKKAGYEVTGFGKKKVDDPQPVAPPNGSLAKVEAVANNVVVTEVMVGVPVMIRPTADTVYGAAKPDCANYGFTSFQYDTGDGKTPSVTRSTGCEPAQVTNTYASPGVYTIKMIATTTDGQKMEATTLITVKPATNGGGVPGTQNPNQQGNNNPGYYDPCGCEPPPCGCY